MTTIYKYPLTITDYQTIDVPSASAMLTVQMQNGAPCLWAMVDAKAKPKTRGVYIVGTGNPVPDAVTRSHYVGSVQDGPFVWHVFVA